MSIANEISRIITNISNAYASLEAKGAVFPGKKNSSNLARTIETINGSGEQTQTLTCVNKTNSTEGDKVFVNLQPEGGVIDVERGESKYVGDPVRLCNHGRVISPNNLFMGLNSAYSGNVSGYYDSSFGGYKTFESSHKDHAWAIPPLYSDQYIMTYDQDPGLAYMEDGVMKYYACSGDKRPTNYHSGALIFDNIVITHDNKNFALFSVDVAKREVVFLTSLSLSNFFYTLCAYKRNGDIVSILTEKGFCVDIDLKAGTIVQSNTLTLSGTPGNYSGAVHLLHKIGDYFISNSSIWGHRFYKLDGNTVTVLNTLTYGDFGTDQYVVFYPVSDSSFYAFHANGMSLSTIKSGGVIEVTPHPLSDLVGGDLRCGCYDPENKISAVFDNVNKKIWVYNHNTELATFYQTDLPVKGNFSSKTLMGFCSDKTGIDAVGKETVDVNICVKNKGLSVTVDSGSETPLTVTKGQNLTGGLYYSLDSDNAYSLETAPFVGDLLQNMNVYVDLKGGVSITALALQNAYLCGRIKLSETFPELETIIDGGGIYRLWEQPVLSNNGTLGADVAACASSSNESGMDAYKAFDGDSSTKWGSSSADVPDWLCFYNPTELFVGSVDFVFTEQYSAGEIQGSNDNSEWTTIGTFSDNTSTTLSVACDNSVGFKYIRAWFTAVYNPWGKVVSMKINAQLPPTNGSITVTKGIKVSADEQTVFYINADTTKSFEELTDGVVKQVNMGLYLTKSSDGVTDFKLYPSEPSGFVGVLKLSDVTLSDDLTMIVG